MNTVAHPRELLDVVCVADLATWWAFKMAWLGPPRTPVDSWQTIREKLMPGHPAEGCVQTQLNRHETTVSPLTVLLRRFAWEDPGLRPLAGCACPALS
ncbi:hypothetical protein [Streptomyces sp. NPDC000410]|uniref:hypothetical protein n=1 Tax=Streptomyces sp. NPDC000410 TaxID=3154254 RepID=UPI00332E4A16